MFPKDKARLCMLYALSPLHAGSGQAIGAVDLPIQRERHTGWPHVQASGVKGALRDWFHRFYLANGAACRNIESQANELTDRVFGKAETGQDASGQAGAISISDARLLAFPVRSNVAPFVWVTCPSVLKRLGRDLVLCRVELPVSLPEPKEDSCIPVVGVSKRDVVLEDLAVRTQETELETPLSGTMRKLAPEITRLLVVSDEHFSFLVRTATEVQPQIAIDMDKGTAKDGSLRYQELLPADSVLYFLVFFGQERTGDGALAPEAIMDCVTTAISTHVQIGGDVTLGRGIMSVRWVSTQKEEGGV